MSHDDNKSDNTLKVTMISSLFCGSLAKSITHPLDTIKAKLQVNTETTVYKIRDVLKHTIEKEGLKGLYQGIRVHVLGAIPGSVLYFTSYEYFKKQLLLKDIKISEFLVYFLGGMFAETVSCLVFVPVDVIKERLQVQSNLKSFSYYSDIHAVKHIFKNEGIRGIYKAYGATVMSFGPLSAFYFMFYEFFKGFFVRNDANYYIEKIKDNKTEEELKKQDISFSKSIMCSSMASFIASVVTNPLDLVKLRMQVQRGGKEGKCNYIYKNIFQGMFYVYKKFGFLELYRGCLARALFHTPNGALTMTFLEIVKPFVRRNLTDCN